MTLSEAQNILMGDPTPEEVERVAKEYIKENPKAESIRTPDGKRELMAFALRTWDDEVPSQYSYKQRAWTLIKDDAPVLDESALSIADEGFDSEEYDRIFDYLGEVVDQEVPDDVKQDIKVTLNSDGYFIGIKDEYDNFKPYFVLDREQGKEFTYKVLPGSPEWVRPVADTVKQKMNALLHKIAEQTHVRDAANSMFATVVRIVSTYEEEAKRFLRKAGFKVLREQHIPEEPGATYLIIEGAHPDEVRVAAWNEDWYAGSRVTSMNAPFIRNAQPVMDSADPELDKVTRALKKAFASFAHPKKDDWEVRTRRLNKGHIWVVLFRPEHSVFHAFDVTPGRGSFNIRESEYAKKLSKAEKPAFFYELLPLFTKALQGVKITDSHIREKDYEALRNVINSELEAAGLLDMFAVDSIHNGFSLNLKEEPETSVLIGFNSMGGLSANVVGSDRSKLYLSIPNLEPALRKIVKRMGDVHVVDAAPKQ